MRVRVSFLTTVLTDYLQPQYTRHRPLCIVSGILQPLALQGTKNMPPIFPLKLVGRRVGEVAGVEAVDAN